VRGDSFAKKRTALPDCASLAYRQQFLLVALHERAATFKRLLKILEIVHIDRELGVEG
jgi:hypothetical protein